jgi:predicted hotdog family 3-hydroxylacyl-ACP dehydratase
MCLLDRVLAHDPVRTVCAVDPKASALLARPDGSVPAFVGLEYLAQCIAAHGGLAARACGEPLRPGLFLGARRVSFGVQSFVRDRELLVEVRHHRGERGLVAFDGEVREAPDGPPLVQGRLNVYIVESWKELDGDAGEADGGGAG